MLTIKDIQTSLKQCIEDNNLKWFMADRDGEELPITDTIVENNCITLYQQNCLAMTPIPMADLARKLLDLDPSTTVLVGDVDCELWGCDSFDGVCFYSDIDDYIALY